ncbi:MAG: sugar-binding protein [Victivallaceae bacterium]|nr:sugar-binding protein [Victivallaceae bacterium]
MKNFFACFCALSLALWCACGQCAEVFRLSQVVTRTIEPGKPVLKLAEFPAVMGRMYQVTLETSLPENMTPPVLRIRFYEKDGRDLAVTEKALGFEPSERKILLQNGKTVLSAIAGRNQTTPSKGVVSLEVPPGSGKYALTLRSLQVEENPPISEQGSASGIEIATPAPGSRHTRNLASNPSFEEGANGMISNWKRIGAGSSGPIGDSYTGARALCIPSGCLDQWEMEPFPIREKDFFTLVYRAKFSRYATPCGHLDPVQIVWLRMNSANQWQELRSRSRREFPFGNFVVKNAYGQYQTIVVPPQQPPVGATHVKLRIAVQETYHHGLGDNFAHWGDVKIDDLLFWAQPENAPKLDASLSSTIFAPLFAAGNDLPPFLPVGAKKENSAALYQLRGPNSNFVFTAGVAGKKQEVSFAIGNLLAVPRKLRLQGKLLDARGIEFGRVDRTFDLAPYKTGTFSIPTQQNLPFGAYSIDAELTEQGRQVGGGVIRFARIAHRPNLDDKERFHRDYMFDLHPSAFNGGWPIDDPDAAEYEARTMRMLGVRGVRLASHLRYLDYTDPEKNAQTARTRAGICRKYALALIRRHNLDGYVTFTEQGRHNLPKLPKTEKELAAFARFFEVYAAELAPEIRFIIFGNEGIGAHTMPAGTQGNLFSRSSFCGNADDWVRIYLAARKGAKKGAPALPFGPGQACDENAEVPAMLRKIAGKDFPADCWAFNAYGDTPRMARNLATATAAFSVPPKFAVIPERGFVAPVRGPGRISGELEQAIQCLRIYTQTRAEAPNVRHLAWFIFDGSNIGTSDQSHGLFEGNGPRPIAAAYAVMTDTLGAGNVVADRKISGGRFLVWERINQNPSGKATRIGVAWSDSPRKLLVCCNPSEKLVVQDMFGNRKTIPATGGLAEIQLDRMPVYLLGSHEIAISEQLILQAENVSSAPDRQMVRLTVRNNSKQPVRFRLKANPPPAMSIELNREWTTLAPGKTIRYLCPVRFLKRDFRRKIQIDFTAELENNVAYHTVLSSLFAGVGAAPEHFRPELDSDAWKNAELFRADQRRNVVICGKSRWQGHADLSAKVALLADERNLYVRAVVRDDVFQSGRTKETLFLQDALELGFQFDDGPDWQFLAGKSDSGDKVYRCRPTAGVPDGAKVTVRRDEKAKTTVYFVTLPWSDFGSFRPEPGKSFRFGIIIDDSDRPDMTDRKFIHWFGDGIHLRDPKLFSELTIYEKGKEKR